MKFVHFWNYTWSLSTLTLKFYVPFTKRIFQYNSFLVAIPWKFRVGQSDRYAIVEISVFCVSAPSLCPLMAACAAAIRA